MSRILISVRRPVENERESSYDAAWLAFRDAAIACGAKAWRFRSATNAEIFLEFMEFRVEADPRKDPGLKRAHAALKRLGEGESQEWLDANL